MSYLTMHCEVSIGNLVFKSLNSFTITQDIENCSDQATIKLARNYKEIAGSPVIDLIKPGMPVEIKCGYNGILKTEFTGFVKPGINDSFPLVIECDELFFLRQNNHIISERNITLKQLLQRIAPEYKIECLELNLGKVRFSNESTVQILEKLKKDWGFFSHIHNKILHVGFAFDFKPSFTKRHDYKVGENIKDLSNLKFSSDIDFNTQIKVKVHKSDGKTEEIVYGMKDINGTMEAVKIGGGKDDKVKDEKGTIKTFEVGYIGTDEAEQMAKAQLKRIIYSGYTGSFTSFCEPRTNAGDSVQLINPAYPKRNATYLVEKVQLTYEEAHIEREIFITYKVA